MNSRTWVLFSLVAVSFFHLQTTVARSDEVVSRSGEILRGELLGVQNGVSQFKSIYGNKFSLSLDQISNLTTVKDVVVNCASGDRIIGRFVATGSGGKVAIQSRSFGRLELALSEIRSVEVPDLSPTALPPGELARVTGKGQDTKAVPPSIGKQSEDSDIRQVYLRQSTVLLKKIQQEFDLGFSYSSQRTENLTLVAGVPTTEIVTVRRFDVPMAYRIGLSDRAEAYVNMPFVYARETRSTPAGETITHNSGIGDVGAGLKYVLFRETDIWPDVIVSAGFTMPTGESPYSANPAIVPLGSGHWGLNGSFTLIKTSDPAVLFFGMSYAHSFPRTFGGVDIQPGESIGANFGVGFAVNRQISLSFEVNGAFQTEYRVGSVRDFTSSVEPVNLRSAVTIRLSKSQVIEPSVSFGINNDAPQAVVGLTYTYKH